MWFMQELSCNITSDVQSTSKDESYAEWKENSSLRAEMEANKRKVEQLKNKVTKVTERDGIIVDEDLGKDLRDNDGYHRWNYEEVWSSFWQKQEAAASQKQRCQIRWHPMIICWCLHLQFMSSSAYDAFRSSRIVILPSECTVRDNRMPAKPGFTPDVG